MCWSFEVSVASYLVVLASTACMWRRNKPNDRWIALLVLLVGQGRQGDALGEDVQASTNQTSVFVGAA